MIFGGVTIPGHPDLANIQKLDVLPVDMLRRMSRIGIAIDREWFADLSCRLDIRKQELRKDILEFIPEEQLGRFLAASDSDEIEFNVNSASQIGELLFDMLGVGRGQKLKKTKDGSRISTGKKQLETLKTEHEVIPLILEFRECSKLKSTYTDALPLKARLHRRGADCNLCGLDHDAETWRIHSEQVTTRTDTGRIASRRPNLANIPSRSHLGREVRKGFIASPGKKLVARDFAQIELRLMADRANEQNMINIFLAGGDIHQDTAMRAFGIDDPKKVDKMLHRAPSKAVNFSIAYRISDQGLYDTMAMTYASAGVPLPGWLDVEWCAKFMLKWFDLYPSVHEFMNLTDYRARRYGVVWTPFGRVRQIPEVRSVHEKIRAAGLRQAGNMPIQGFAADVFKLGMSRVDVRMQQFREAGIYAEALLPIHDELVSEVDEEWVDEVGEIVGWEMSEALRDEETGEYMCRVPIATDGHSMSRWEKD
jgi:DNA polymerase-1